MLKLHETLISLADSAEESSYIFQQGFEYNPFIEGSDWSNRDENEQRFMRNFESIGYDAEKLMELSNALSAIAILVERVETKSINNAN